MGDIFGAIAQYGIVPVVVGVVLYLLILWQQRRAESKKRKEEEEAQRAREEAEYQKEQERRAQDRKFEERLLDMVSERMREPAHTVQEQKENKDINEFIVKQLNCLVDEGASRAYMFSFHNGGKDVLGRGFLKMSMTQEDVGDDIVPIMAKYQNMPRMLFPNLYAELDEKDYYNVDNLEDIKKDDPFTYQFLIEHNVKSAMFRAIKREDGLMIGFIGMECIEETWKDKKLAARNIDKKANRIIGALLGAQIN